MTIADSPGLSHRVEIEHVISPADLRVALPLTAEVKRNIAATRSEIGNLLIDADSERLLVVLGPCSLHDPAAALEYAGQVKTWQKQYGDYLLLVMRAYVEKPRTRLGWKGLLNDPRLDGSFRIGEGLRLSRRLLLDINSLGVPTATEFLDLTTASYLEDLTSWSAVGARTSESPSHRQMASGLPFPTGFKNTTSGDLCAAVNGILAAGSPHHILAAGEDGSLTVIATTGNPHAHLILRGGQDRVNYDPQSVDEAARYLQGHKLPARLMVDCGHGNSSSTLEGQRLAARNTAAQIASGSRVIAGVMLESNLVEGRQAFKPGALRYGQSVTDACIGLDDTAAALAGWHEAMRTRQAAAGSARFP